MKKQQPKRRRPPATHYDVYVDLPRAFAPLLPNAVDGSGNPNLTTRYCVMTGGRGSGKSFALATALAELGQYPGYGILFTRWTMASAKDSIIPEFLDKVELLRIPGFTSTLHDVSHIHGSSIMFRGIKTSSGNQVAKLKSLTGLNVWVLDEAEEMPDEETFDIINLSIRDNRRPCMVILCLNPCHKRHWIYRRFFERQEIPTGFNGVRDNVTYIHTTFRDNILNLPADYLRLAAEAEAGDPRRYENVWLGAWVDEVIGALWSYEMIAGNRREWTEVPDLVRVVVAVDPAATSGPSADETGIVVAGKGSDGHYYVLEDVSGRMPPHEWARLAVQRYEAHKASAIVAEVNNGGDMVGETIHHVDPYVVFEKVWASRGKITRAEPISMLSSKGLLHHVGHLRELESEMMSYTGEKTEESPGRMDAMVWAVSHLCGFTDGAYTDSDLLEGAVRR